MLFVTEISFLGLYEIDWHIEYEDLKEEPVVKPNLGQIQILTKVLPSQSKTNIYLIYFPGTEKNRNNEINSFLW